MRAFSYYLSVSLVSFSSIFSILSHITYLLGIPLTHFHGDFLLSLFASPIPLMFTGVLPGFIRIGLYYLQAFLSFRRIFLIIVKREGVPSTFKGFPKIIAYIGTFFLIIALIVLLLSLYATYKRGEGTGIPAAMLSMPAQFCIPFAFFVTELLSMFKQKNTGAN